MNRHLIPALQAIVANTSNIRMIEALHTIVAGRKEKLLQTFNKVLKKQPELKEEVQKEIAWAIEHLKRKDRVDWYLRIIKKGMLDKDDRDYKELLRLKNDLLHYVKNAEVNDYDKVSKYIWEPNASPSDLNWDLSELEEESINKAKTKKERLLDPEEGGSYSEFMKFDDGWVWHKIDAPQCELEGKAMDHCGNTGNPQPGDQILSLREPVKQEDKILYKPHATFIINDGILGEMKGRSNQKPSKDFHDYIVELLKHPEIKMIGGGGYKPEGNFNLKDLTDTQRKEVLKEKPGIDSIETYFEANGADETLNNVLRKTLGTEGATLDKENGLAYIAVYESLADFPSEYISNRESEFDSPDSYHYDDDDHKIKLLSTLERERPQDFKKLKTMLVDKFESDVNSFFDDEEDKVKDFVKSGDAKEVYELIDDQYISDVDEALENALEVKVKNTAAYELSSFLENYGDQEVFLYPLKDYEFDNKKMIYETPIAIAETLKTFFEWFNKNREKLRDAEDDKKSEIVNNHTRGIDSMIRSDEFYVNWEDDDYIELMDDLVKYLGDVG